VKGADNEMTPRRATADTPVALNRTWLFTAAAAGMFTFGMVIAMLGTLFGLPAVRERLSLDFAGQGALLGTLSMGLLVSSVIAGPLLHRLGSKTVLCVASLLVAGSLAGFALVRSFGPAAAAAALLGAGGSWLNVGTNALVADVFPEERGRWLNLLGVFFGIGALFVPFLVSLAFDSLSVPGTMIVCAGVAAVTLALSAAPRFPAPHRDAPFSVVEMLRTARYPGVLLFAVLLLFQSGNESSLSGWTSTYIASVGWSPRAGTIVLLGYWVMAILGRSFSARLQAWIGKPQLVLSAAGLSVAGCLILLAGAGSLPLLTIGAWTTALALSAVFPTTLAIAGDRHPGSAGLVFGFLFSVSNLGAVLSPWLIGQVSQAAGVRLGMLVPLCGTLGVTVCALLVLRPEPQAVQRG
jgi:MFS family permease